MVSEDILKQDIEDLDMRLGSVTEEADIACGYRTA
jgi:hypothetical protein